MADGRKAEELFPGGLRDGFCDAEDLFTDRRAHLLR